MADEVYLPHLDRLNELVYEFDFTLLVVVLIFLAGRLRDKVRAAYRGFLGVARLLGGALKPTPRGYGFRRS